MLTRLGTPSHPDLPGVVGASGVDSPSPGGRSLGKIEGGVGAGSKHTSHQTWIA